MCRVLVEMATFSAVFAPFCSIFGVHRKSSLYNEDIAVQRNRHAHKEAAIPRLN